MNLVKYRVLNSCRILSPTGLNTPYPLPATHCLLILYFDTGKGGGARREPERMLEGQQVTELGQNYQHDCITSV
jgi:hypothetical protein